MSGRRVVLGVVGAVVAVGIAVFLYNVRQNAKGLERVEAACGDIERLMAQRTPGAGASFLPILRGLCDGVRAELAPTSRINFGRSVSITPDAAAVTAVVAELDQAEQNCLAMMQQEIGSGRWEPSVVADVLKQMIAKDGGEVPTSTGAVDVDLLVKQTCDAMMLNARTRVDDLKKSLTFPIWEWPDELSIRADHISLATQKADVVVAFGRVIPEDSPVDASNASSGVRVRSQSAEPLVVDVLLQADDATVDGHRAQGLPTDADTCKKLLLAAGDACLPRQLRVRVRALAPGSTVLIEPTRP